MSRSLSLFAICLALAVTASDARKPSVVDQAVKAYQSNHTFAVPSAGSIEVAFSPDEGAEPLVIKVIDSAHSELKILSYSFTSAPVVDALLRARHRGVAVTLVADYKDNITEDKSGKARAALSSLQTAGAEVRAIKVYAIHHDKVVIADRSTVELGSFNYSSSAAHKNSENVLVNWQNPKLAEVYLGHFMRNYAQAQAYVPSY